MLPKPNGIWYRIGTIVRHLPPTLSMHMTNDVTVVPPLKIASRKRIAINSQKCGANADKMPKIDWNRMQVIRMGLRPLRSARAPNSTLPAMKD